MIQTLYKSANKPTEIKALLRLKIQGNNYAPPKESLEVLANQLDDRDFCYAALGKVSRSFSAVIQQLPDDLKDTVCVFYLVLRALDTIEDDMDFPPEKKIPLLTGFHDLCSKQEFSISGVGDNPDYRVLLENYPKVCRTQKSLKIEAQEIITEITRRMGKGMAYFTHKEIDSLDDFDEYCHYVAGLVGIGLTKLFISSNPDVLELKEIDKVANSMGLFLQKTNIIRDFHEDLHSSRTFWPREVWKNHVDKVEDLSDPGNSTVSIMCLNHMISDALKHIPDCLDYMCSIREEKIFRFASVPQIMAVATLSEMYNNPNVLTGVVKMRKGLAARLLMYPIKLKDVQRYFVQNIRKIERKNKLHTPHYKETAFRLQSIKNVLETKFQ